MRLWWRITTLGVAAAALVQAAPGTIVRSFSLPGQPAMGVRGLAKDWDDGNVWAVGVQATGNVWFGKFNAATGSMVTSWGTLQGLYWAYDAGYGYLYGGNRMLVLPDGTNLRLYTTAGLFVTSIAAGFSVAGLDCDWLGSYIFAGDSSSAIIRRGPGTWTNWASYTGGTCSGLATGWGRVFIVTPPTDAKFYEFTGIYNSSGSFVRSFPHSLNLMTGMSIGRVNGYGDEETLFVACIAPSYLIYEVSVGDVSGTAVFPASLGRVKALFK